LRLTAPITENFATTLRYNYKVITYTGEDDWQDNLSAPYQNLINNGPWTQSTVSQTFTYNTLDDQNLPRDGFIAKLTTEFAGLGGTKYFTAFMEASMPTPGMPQDIGLRSSVFVDSGTLYGNQADLYGDVLKDGSALRASAGVGLTWSSPFGVINLSYAVPFLK